MKSILPEFNKASVLIIGDIMLDRYWHGSASRISPEAPVPIVHVDRTVELPGGAGNVALNVCSVGAKSILMGVTGDDAEANTLERKLTQKGITTVLQREANLPTITKLRVVSQHQQLIRCDFENMILPTQSLVLQQEYRQYLPTVGAVIISDYGKGTVSDPRPYIRMASEQDIPVLIDPKGSDYTKYRGATMLTPNRKEFEAVVGLCHTEDELINRGHALMEQLELKALLITRGEQGMTLLQGDASPIHLPARAREVFDVTGAGDTVIALMASAMASGSTIPEAMTIANIAAGIVVSKLGAATVNVSELRRAMHSTSLGGVTTLEHLKEWVADAKRAGEKIVMTNGCFDVLHVGHVQYLKDAKQRGSRLIVAVNTDASVRRLKGPARPINSVMARMAVLAELGAVDWVFPFEQDTPLEVIQALTPDVLVKGADYTPSQVVGADWVMAHGGEVAIIDFVPGYSSTTLIEKMREEETV